MKYELRRGVWKMSGPPSLRILLSQDAERWPP